MTLNRLIWPKHARAVRLGRSVGSIVMTGFETNTFSIDESSQISGEYRVYRIRGLVRGHPEYHHNRQLLQKKLSFALRTPVCIINRGDELYLAVLEGASEPPSPFSLVRQTIYIDPTSEQIPID